MIGIRLHMNGPQPPDDGALRAEGLRAAAAQAPKGIKRLAVTGCATGRSAIRRLAGMLICWLATASTGMCGTAGNAGDVMVHRSVAAGVQTTEAADDAARPPFRVRIGARDAAYVEPSRWAGGASAAAEDGRLNGGDAAGVGGAGGAVEEPAVLPKASAAIRGRDPDGSMRPKAGERRPRWLDTAGHADGVRAIRTSAVQHATSTADAAGPLPTADGEEGVSFVARWVLVALAVSTLPPLLLLTTCYLRFAIVFGLLRQALGGAFLPPQLVVHGLCLALSVVVMEPVWRAAYEEGIGPYLAAVADGKGTVRPSAREALEGAVRPVRVFMQQQIERSGNTRCVSLLWRYRQAARRTGRPRDVSAGTPSPTGWDVVPFDVLLPAFVLSELTVALTIGVRVLIPFMVIDLFVASVLSGLGWMPGPSTWIALPLKLIVFLAVDGWTTTVGMVLRSVGAVAAGTF
ncbi:MAG: flagellar biosynthetic protein FliP [Planctomycetota bacterium]|nr:MAG: flagellar biosynthetic protein FliP [Planctomycetota bacterium]